MVSATDSVVGRVRNLGVRSVSAVDLVAVGFSRTEADANEAHPKAQVLLRSLDKIVNAGEASFATVKSETGIDGYEALRCFALIELGRRAGRSGRGDIDTIDCAQDAYELLTDLRHEKKEHFYAVLLDSKNQLIRKAEIHVGTLNMSVVGPREIFREAIRDGASSIIVAHNHPSGDPTPSPEDVQVTKQLVSIGDMLDIPVLDHIVVGDRKFSSLKDMGLM